MMRYEYTRRDDLHAGSLAAPVQPVAVFENREIMLAGSKRKALSGDLESCFIAPAAFVGGGLPLSNQHIENKA